MKHPWSNKNTAIDSSVTSVGDVHSNTSNHKQLATRNKHLCISSERSHACKLQHISSAHWNNTKQLANKKNLFWKCTELFNVLLLHDCSHSNTLHRSLLPSLPPSLTPIYHSFAWENFSTLTPPPLVPLPPRGKIINKPATFNTVKSMWILTFPSVPMHYIREGTRWQAGRRGKIRSALL